MALGTITKTVATRSTGRLTVEELQANRLAKWDRQAIARQLLPGERVATCLHQVAPVANGVSVLYDQEHQAAHYGGLIVCGSVWHCSMCAAKISEKRRDELDQAITRCIERGGAVWMATYTISHKKFDSLKSLLKAFLKARQRMKRTRAFRETKQAFGVLGTVSVLEVTWSDLNGWHPHIHELIFTESADSTIGALGYEAASRVQWQRAAADEGLTMDEHGYKFDRTFGAVADYVAKFGREPSGRVWGVEDEVTKGHLKRGRGPVEHYTPFGLLQAIHEGRDELKPIFVEYARQFKGHKQLTWSHGLRALLLVEEVEKTDEELASEQVEEAVTLVVLTRDQWRVVLANDARGELLEVARSGDVNQVIGFLLEIGVSDLKG